jgi:serine/threonine-protein kinase HipA
LLVHRFDREGERRVHQHSFGGLVHVDFNDPGASSYEEYFRCVLRLGMPYAALEQAFLRMLFNVVAVNQDDHVKNLSFQMDERGVWSLAPAYDLTFAHGRGFTARHQMRVRDKTAAIRASDLLAVGQEFGLNDPPKLLQRVREQVARLAEFAARTRVPAEVIAELRAALDLRAKELDAG